MGLIGEQGGVEGGEGELRDEGGQNHYGVWARAVVRHQLPAVAGDHQGPTMVQ